MRPAVYVLLVTAVLGGCQVQPVQEVPFAFVRGGALSAQEYGLLEPYVRSQTYKQRINLDLNRNAPLAAWAYAFAPGFDPMLIKRVSINDFTGASPEAAALGAVLIPYLRTRLDDAEMPTAEADDPATRITISGVVTKNNAIKGPDGEVANRDVQIEARIRQGDLSIAAIQINFLLPKHQTQIIAAPAAMLLGTLIARAIEPDISENKGAGAKAGLYLGNPFYLIRRKGARQGISPDFQTTVFDPPPTAPAAEPVLKPASPPQALLLR